MSNPPRHPRSQLPRLLVAAVVLAATVGLNADGVGRVRMTIREGLTGLVAEQLQPLSLSEAASHPRYKFFPELSEENFHSFLAVPVIDRGLLQGVLTAQTSAPREFSVAERDSLINAAAQLSSVICEARDLEQFIAPLERRLWSLTQNLWWCWDTDTVELFRDIAPVRWRELYHNPISLLSEIPLEELKERVNQLVLHNRISRAFRRMQEYLNSESTWGKTNAGPLQRHNRKSLKSNDIHTRA